jgi:hypothetical protein
MGLLGPGEAAANSTGPRIAVAWNDFSTGSGMIRAISAAAPWDFVTDPLEVGLDPLLRYAFGRLYEVSPADDLIHVVAPNTWTIENSYPLDVGGAPVDIAVVSTTTA